MQDSQNISLQNLSVHIRMNLLSMTSKKLYKRVRLDIKSVKKNKNILKSIKF